MANTRSAIKTVLLPALLACASIASGQDLTRVDQHHAPSLSDSPRVAALSIMQPESVVTLPSPEEPVPSATGLSLSVVEQLAVANSPTIAQAEARIKALHGKLCQVGLAPNPTIGYTASEIGADGKAGQQGAYAGQDFITAHKLQRNRAIVAAEIEQAEQQLAAILRRVQTDVRVRFYETLLAQRRYELASRIQQIADQAAETSQVLLDAQEIPLAGLLQSQVQQESSRLLVVTSQNALDQAWRRLEVLVGPQQLARQSLEGDVSQLPLTLDFEQQLAQLQATSPEIAAAIAGVERSRRVLSRECVEAVPDINAQVSVQYDDSSDDTITGVQVSFPLPLWNRNQGGICRAQADVTGAVRNVERIERQLAQRLADAYREYADARTTAETYANEILTRSQRTLVLVQQGYAEGEVGYLDLLTAQRTFSQTNLAYLDALQGLWRSYYRIEGLLLEDSLNVEYTPVE